ERTATRSIDSETGRTSNDICPLAVTARTSNERGREAGGEAPRTQNVRHTVNIAFDDVVSRAAQPVIKRRIHRIPVAPEPTAHRVVQALMQRAAVVMGATIASMCAVKHDAVCSLAPRDAEAFGKPPRPIPQEV